MADQTFLHTLCNLNVRRKACSDLIVLVTLDCDAMASVLTNETKGKVTGSKRHFVGASC